MRSPLRDDFHEITRMSTRVNDAKPIDQATSELMAAQMAELSRRVEQDDRAKTKKKRARKSNEKQTSKSKSGGSSKRPVNATISVVVSEFKSVCDLSRAERNQSRLVD
jgi:hypothetical protein